MEIPQRLHNLLQQPDPIVINHVITVDQSDPKKTACYDIDVEIEDPIKKCTCPSLRWGLEMQTKLQRWIKSVDQSDPKKTACYDIDVEIEETADISQSKDLKKMTDTHQGDSEIERTAGYFHQPCVQESVFRYFYSKSRLLTAQENNMDLTAKLPDDILFEIFDRLPSLRDKLRLESVNRRFQRCLHQLLNTRPIPLEYVRGKLNGYNVPLDVLTDVVHSLANKAKFDRIDIGDGTIRQSQGFLSALASLDKARLDKVRAFTVMSDIGVTTSLKEALTKCTKVSDVQLNWIVGDLKNCGPALEGKALTRLDIRPFNHCKQWPLIQLYQSLTPNMLKNIKLELHDMDMDMNQLVTELYGGAWAALEEINFNFNFWIVRDLDLAALFSSLTRLPALRKCIISLDIFQPFHQWAAALSSLFTNHIEMRVRLDYDRHTQTGCEFVALIRQLQAVHPELRVGFGLNGDELTLTLGKVSFQKGPVLAIKACADANCIDCGRFYPILLRSLKRKAHQRLHGTGEGHLANGRLDRCRIDSIVADLNEAVSTNPVWRVLSAEMNQAQNQATLTFESLVNQDQFQITAGCGQCLNIGCFGCINVG